MKLRLLYLICLLILTAFSISIAQAAPVPQSNTTTLVGVCYDPISCGNPDGTNFEAATLDVYTERVLANEWPGDVESLKAGIIAIRTFAYRKPGCGAYMSAYTDPLAPLFAYRILNNGSQAFRVGGAGGTQLPVLGKHLDARVQTGLTKLIRASDNGFACAKYKPDTGNPTAARGGSNEDTETLLSVPDPVDTNSPVFVSPWNNPHNTGMSQNGTVAWRSGSDSVKWNYCQLLSHYYANVKIDGCGNEEYRWVWLDVDTTTIVHNGIDTYDQNGWLIGGDEYYGPTFNAPDTMEMGQTYTFSIHLQNTSTVKWWQFGGSWTQIGLYWDGNRGAAQLLTLDEDMDPGEPDNVTVNISPPASGTHCLSVDMYRNGNWFSDQSSPTWPVLTKCISVAEADTESPSNPTNLGSGSSHTPGDWSPTNIIYAQWSGARDNRTPTNQLAYSIDWTTSTSTVPNTNADRSVPNDTSPTLNSGSWYLHVRTRDNAGNWNNSATHFGPFLIDTLRPIGWHQAPEWWPTPNFDVSWNGSDQGGSGIHFDFDYKINTGSYQNWFETTSSGNTTFNKTVNPNDTVHIRACITDEAGNTATPNPCTYSQTQFRTAPYLTTDPTAISYCFLLTDTVPFSSTMLVKNNGPGLLDWTITISHPNLTLYPASGVDVNSGFPAKTVYTVTNPAIVGQHTGVITVSSPTVGVNNNPFIVPVTMRVTADACTYYYHLPIILKQN